MASKEGKVVRPERWWDCRRGAPNNRHNKISHSAARKWRKLILQRSQAHTGPVQKQKQSVWTL